ncbi:MAG TPA: DUF4124 domain-containing protein [Burkholderiaceae bacterium]|nr:DUF4124 domain-containing protein [Burkholderiaceae bacterium]HQR75607.1 DUF4124 domain-containing protein [Burkholderiaceae bacterium]
MVSSVLLSFGVAAPWAAFAQSSEIYMCIDEQGNKSYQNVGSGKGCKRVDVGPVLSMPAPRLPAGRSAMQPAVEERASVSPASFPRVDRDTQRTRDSDRRRILEDELKAEEDRLARLRTEFNNGEPERRGDERNFALYQERIQRLREDIARVETNVGALRREIALLRTQ